MLKWCHLYLINRKQFVSFNGESFKLLNNNCGVPQGSVLNFNDLPNISKILNSYLLTFTINLIIN